MEEVALRVEKLTKKYKGFKLGDINFKLNKGYILGVIGRNGAGKTTLINCILDVCKYDEGIIQLNNGIENIHINSDKAELGFIVEPMPFLTDMTLEDNGRLLGEFYSSWNQQMFLEKLGEYGLNLDITPKELSKGMQVRFQLAFALAHNPKLLVLDEPTGGLDPVFRKEFLEIVQSAVQDTLVSVIISTHLTNDLDKVADYILMLDEGEQLIYMDKESLFDNYPIVSGNIEQLSWIKKEKCGRIRQRGKEFMTIVKDLEYFKTEIRNNSKLEIQRADIADIMYYLSKGELGKIAEVI